MALSVDRTMLFWWLSWAVLGLAVLGGALLFSQNVLFGQVMQGHPVAWARPVAVLGMIASLFWLGFGVAMARRLRLGWFHLGMTVVASLLGVLHWGLWTWTAFAFCGLCER